MTDKEIKEAVERFSATDWVNPYNRKAMKTLLDLAQSVLDAKMPEKIFVCEECEKIFTEEEKCEKHDYGHICKAKEYKNLMRCESYLNGYISIDDFRLFFAKKMLTIVDQVIEPHIQRTLAIGFHSKEAKEYLDEAIHKHMEE